MKEIHLIGITPEELQMAIADEIKDCLGSFEPKPPTEYLTRKETAELLSVDLSTLWHWVKKGKLQAYGISGRVYFKREEIEQSLIKL